METIPRNDCLKIGYLQKPHGVKGDIVLQFMPEFGASLEGGPVLFLEIDGLLVPFFPDQEGIRFRTGETALVKLRWIDNEVQAREICSLKVYIKREDLIRQEDDLSLHELIGFKLIDHQLGEIGAIENVEDYGGNLVLQLTYHGREVLVPFNEDFLLRFDETNREIEMKCPEGIFDFG